MISIPSLSLKYKLLLFTIVPCVLTTTLLSMVYFYSIKMIQINDAEEKIITLMHQLQERFTEFKYDDITINSIITSAMRDNNIITISYYDGVEKSIHQQGTKMHAAQEPLLALQNQYVVSSTPEGFRVRVLLLSKPLGPDMQSWIDIAYSTQEIERNWFESLRFTTLCNIVIIAVFLVCLWPMSNRVLSHLRRLSRQLDQLLEGDYDIKEVTVSTKEIQLLFNQLKDLNLAFREKDERNQKKISEATQNLEKMLDQLFHQNTELDQARQDALQASEIKSQFLANISHEVRTPLNGILGYISLLKRSELSDEQEMNIVIIEQCSHSLLSLINDLLDFSKMEADKLVLDKIEFSLYNLLDEVLSLLGLEAQQKGLELASMIAPETPDNIIGDPLRLRQILTNLISNAIKFTHQGSVHVKIAAERFHPETNAWELNFSIIDTGTGLTAKQQKRLFEAFMQADTSITRQYGGTGLGLVISKHLIEKMQGTIRLESTPNEGSTFWFTAMFGKSNEVNSAFPNLPNFKIAICEPLAFTRRSILQRLHAWDVEVREFNNLIELSNSDRAFDIVLYGLKGFEPAPIEQEVIHNLTTQGVHVIVMTVGGDTSHHQILKALGVRKFLMKPIHFKYLADSIKTIPISTRNTSAALKKKQQSNYVLAVDDNLANLRLIELLLKQNDIPVITAQSGSEALIILKKYSISIVLMDIQMPVMDGIETTKKIRIQKSCKHLPIIALTAHALPSEKHNILTAGLDDYLSKPVEEKTLLKTLKKWSNTFSPNSGLLIESKPKNQPVVFDETLCLRRANNLRDLAEDFLKGIHEELESYLDIAALLNTNKDLEQLKHITHRLHGSLKYSGFPELEAAIYELETALKMEEAQEQLANKLTKVLKAGHTVIGLFVKQQLGSFSYLLEST